MGISFTPLSLFPPLVLGQPWATHTHTHYYPAPTQVAAVRAEPLPGPPRVEVGWGAGALPGFVEVFAGVGHPAGGPQALAQGARGHIGERLFLW